MIQPSYRIVFLGLFYDGSRRSPLAEPLMEHYLRGGATTRMLDRSPCSVEMPSIEHMDGRPRTSG